jgi:hypothetical protein
MLVSQAMQEQMTKKIGSLEVIKSELMKKLEEKDAEVVKLKSEKEQLKRTTDMEVSLDSRSCPALLAWLSAQMPLDCVHATVPMLACIHQLRQPLQCVFCSWRLSSWCGTFSMIPKG